MIFAHMHGLKNTAQSIELFSDSLLLMTTSSKITFFFQKTLANKCSPVSGRQKVCHYH